MSHKRSGLWEIDFAAGLGKGREMALLFYSTKCHEIFPSMQKKLHHVQKIMRLS